MTVASSRRREGIVLIKLLRLVSETLLFAAVFLCASGSARAQHLGHFRWQVLPFCQVYELEVTQVGSVYSLNGWTDKCGESVSVILTGTVVPKNNGQLGFGITFNESPFVRHIRAFLDPVTLEGPWHDESGGGGYLIFLGLARTEPELPSPAVNR